MIPGSLNDRRDIVYRRRMKRLLVAVLSLAMFSSGCSIAFLEKPRVTPDNKVECDSTMKYPLIDGVVGIAGIATPFILDRTALKGDPNFLLYIPLWAVGLGTAISAVVGYKRVGRCSDLKDSVGATQTPPPAPAAPAPAAPAPAQ
jgi:hypothetical protein